MARAVARRLARDGRGAPTRAPRRASRARAVARASRDGADAGSESIRVRYDVVRARATAALRRVLDDGADASAVLRKALRPGTARVTNDERAAIARATLGATAWRLRLEAELASATRHGTREARACAERAGDRAEKLILMYWSGDRGSGGRAVVPSAEDARAMYGDGAADLRIAAREENVRWSSDDAIAVGQKTALPRPLVDALIREYGREEALAFGAAINAPGPVTCRANGALARGGADEVAAMLAREGIRTEKTKYGLAAPLAFVLPDGPPKNGGIFGCDVWRRGYFEVMDEGSQCIANAVGAREGERILDACAGNGGKTLAMAANMNGHGEICAFDIDKRRLSHLKANAARARVAALVTTTESLDELASESFDAILVDAPCSSVGALRRTPSLRHSYDDPRELAKVQAEILDGVARLLKPGGRLVYATCSVLSIENQDVAEAFERKHDDFAPWPFEDSVLTSPAVELRSHERLFLPHVHGTDGFYIARFVRRTAD